MVRYSTKFGPCRTATSARIIFFTMISRNNSYFPCTYSAYTCSSNMIDNNDINCIPWSLYYYFSDYSSKHDRLFIIYHRQVKTIDQTFMFNNYILFVSPYRWPLEPYWCQTWPLHFLIPNPNWIKSLWRYYE